MTAVEWLENQLKSTYMIEGKLPLAYTLDLVRQAKQMEREQLAKAMHYALDEDGHTGDWRIKFINEYYESNFGVRHDRP